MFGDTSWHIATVICQLATITWNWPQSHQVTQSVIASINPLGLIISLQSWDRKTEPNIEDALEISTKESGASLMELRVCPVHDGIWLFVSSLLIASCWCWLLWHSDDVVFISPVLLLMFFFVFVFSYFAFILFSEPTKRFKPSVSLEVSELGARIAAKTEFNLT